MRFRFMLASLAAIEMVCCLGNAMAAETSANWPRYGGPNGDFHIDEPKLPNKWSASNILWKSVLGGVGQSSPVTWGNRLFLTTSERTSGGDVARYVICLNRENGKLDWKQLVATGPGETIHKMNSFASASCATDGECVVAYFGPAGLHCLEMDGKQKWSLDLVEPTGPFGFGGSPIILDDMVIQNCDAAGPSYLIAVDKNSGEQRWRTARKDSPKGGWCTPILIDTGSRMELVLNGEFGVQSYDPATGADYWSCKSFNGRGTPMPAWAKGLLVTVNGKSGDIYAVRPGGSGDVTDTHMAWHTNRRGRDLSSPVVVGDHCFVISMSGIGTLYDVSSGKELWRERLGGNYSASPLVANGLIYVMDEAGATSIVRPGKQFELVAKNDLGDTGEIFRTSPTPNRQQLFLRSDKALYCIGASSAQ